jgi:hypothetical protein
MAGTWTTERFPQFEQAIRRLTNQHRELQDEPLHLAIAYQPAPPREQQDVYLFEVIGGLGESSPDKELFEVVFDPNGRLQTNFTQQLHLILTRPAEFKSAMEEHWPSADEIVQAVRNGDYEMLHADMEGKEILERLAGNVSRREVVRHG